MTDEKDCSPRRSSCGVHGRYFDSSHCASQTHPPLLHEPGTQHLEAPALENTCLPPCSICEGSIVAATEPKPDSPFRIRKHADQAASKRLSPAATSRNSMCFQPQDYWKTRTAGNRRRHRRSRCEYGAAACASSSSISNIAACNQPRKEHRMRHSVLRDGSAACLYPRPPVTDLQEISPHRAADMPTLATQSLYVLRAET